VFRGTSTAGLFAAIGRKHCGGFVGIRERQGGWDQIAEFGFVRKNNVIGKLPSANGIEIKALGADCR
jgi:hypothetical protein